MENEGLGLSNVKPDIIKTMPTYNSKRYKNFELRVVEKDGIPIGEYHVKATANYKLRLNSLKEALPGCDVGLIDPEGVLNLEYPIYIIINNEMVKDCFEDIMEKYDIILEGDQNVKQ